MNTKLNFKAFKKKSLKDEAFKAEYEALRPEFEITEKFIKAKKRNYTTSTK